MYIYYFDCFYHLCGAIEAEREAIKKTGIELLSINLWELWDNIEFDCSEFKMTEPIHMKELPCEKSDGYFVFRDGPTGVFMESSAFPRSRETRAPLISEILPHKAELDPKFLYLCEAPKEDNKGNLVMIRFSRKNKEQYVMSEDKEGKATGWTAHYRDGQWDIKLPKAKKKAAKKKIVKKKAE